jgi:ABC-2 type transport system permease protein
VSAPTESTDDATEPGRTPGADSILGTIVRRELSTAVGRSTYVGVWFGLVTVLLGIAWFGGGIRAGYLSTIIDLSTPLELLVPVFGFMLGYRAIIEDRRRGILDVLRTYPVSPWQVVIGVYLGRAIGLTAVLSTALSVLIAPIALTDSREYLFYASHTSGDSIGLFFRFIVLTVAFALVMLAVAIAISALAGATRTAIAALGVALFGLFFVADIALVFGLARGAIAEGSLVNSLAISPLSAYRGLVIETTVSVTAGTGPKAASPIASALGLFVWWIGSLAVAAVAISR